MNAGSFAKETEEAVLPDVFGVLAVDRILHQVALLGDRTQIVDEVHEAQHDRQFQGRENRSVRGEEGDADQPPGYIL